MIVITAIKDECVNILNMKLVSITPVARGVVAISKHAEVTMYIYLEWCSDIVLSHHVVAYSLNRMYTKAKKIISMIFQSAGSYP